MKMKTTNSRLVITGMGAVTPIGIGVENYWKNLVAGAVGVGLLGWLVYFATSGSLQMPLLRSGFRLVVFSIVIMCVVLFYSHGIMGTRELPDLFRKKPKKAAAVGEGGGKDA